MQCNPIQQLILTDYLDDCLTKTDQLALENHLASCAECRELATNARQILLQPFADYPRHEPPPAIWQAVALQISTERPRAFGFMARINGFTHRFALPKPALALAAALVLLVASGLFLQQHSNHRNTANLDLEDQVTYLAYLVEGNGSDDNFDTSIEEYFL